MGTFLLQAVSIYMLGIFYIISASKELFRNSI